MNDPKRSGARRCRQREREPLGPNQEGLDPKYESLYASLSDGAVALDLSTKCFLWAGASACRMLGCSRDELLSASLHRIPPALKLADFLAKSGASAKARVKVNESISLARKDGSVLFADIATHRMFFGARPCVIGFLRDVTRRIRTFERLKKDRTCLRRMLDMSERDRRLVGFEIHDGLAQLLAAALMHLRAFGEATGGDRAEDWEAFRTGLELVERSHREARRLISNLRTGILESLGLVAAIDDLVCQSRGEDDAPVIEFVHQVSFDRLPPALENCVFRIVQEGLNNALRHSRSPRVRVSLSQHEVLLRVEIQDWGVGLDPDASMEGHFGLEGIKERARVFGGEATFQSSPGKGVRVAALVPFVEARPRCSAPRVRSGHKRARRSRQPHLV